MVVVCALCTQIGGAAVAATHPNSIQCNMPLSTLSRANCHFVPNGKRYTRYGDTAKIYHTSPRRACKRERRMLFAVQIVCAPLHNQRQWQSHRCGMNFTLHSPHSLLGLHNSVARFGSAFGVRNAPPVNINQTITKSQSKRHHRHTIRQTHRHFYGPTRQTIGEHRERRGRSFVWMLLSGGQLWSAPHYKPYHKTHVPMHAA